MSTQFPKLDIPKGSVTPPKMPTSREPMKDSVGKIPNSPTPRGGIEGLSGDESITSMLKRDYTTIKGASMKEAGIRSGLRKALGYPLEALGWGLSAPGAALATPGKVLAAPGEGLAQVGRWIRGAPSAQQKAVSKATAAEIESAAQQAAADATQGASRNALMMGAGGVAGGGLGGYYLSKESTMMKGASIRRSFLRSFLF